MKAVEQIIENVRDRNGIGIFREPHVPPELRELADGQRVEMYVVIATDGYGLGRVTNRPGCVGITFSNGVISLEGVCHRGDNGNRTGGAVCVVWSAGLDQIGSGHAGIDPTPRAEESRTRFVQRVWPRVNGGHERSQRLLDVGV